MFSKHEGLWSACVCVCVWSSTGETELGSGWGSTGEWLGIVTGEIRD